MGTFPLWALLIAIGLPDRGIWSELDKDVRIAPPNWALDTGAYWLRLDHTHRILTVYQGDAAVIAYPLVKDLDPARTDPRLPDLWPLLRPGDAAELQRALPKGAEITIQQGAPLRAEDHDGDGVVDSLDILLGAKKLVVNHAAYREEYRGLKYPGGDVPRTEGVCTDTVIRSLRNAGWDLQKEVHEELLRVPQAYPLAKDKKPDASIDHRRVRMLVPWFNRHFVKVPQGAPLRPGDIVFLDTFPSKSGADHVGIVSDRLGPSGQPLLVNNWTDGYSEQEMDLLHFVPSLYRFRAPPRPAQRP